MLELPEGRVLVCGSRRWPWPSTVEAVLDRLADRYGDRLVVIEGAATGADACRMRMVPRPRPRRRSASLPPRRLGRRETRVPA
ncbi:SLOG family protein [Streptomyces peucetius]